jgi:hypothetical protein
MAKQSRRRLNRPPLPTSRGGGSRQRYQDMERDIMRHHARPHHKPQSGVFWKNKAPLRIGIVLSIALNRRQSSLAIRHRLVNLVTKNGGHSPYRPQLPRALRRAHQQPLRYRVGRQRSVPSGSVPGLALLDRSSEGRGAAQQRRGRL